MSEGRLHKSSEIKRGTGERIFLAFAGRRHHSSDTSQIPAKADIKQEFIGILLLTVAACMIVILVWHFLSEAR